MNSALIDFKLKATRFATLLTIGVILVGLGTHIISSTPALHWLLLADIATIALLLYSYRMLTIKPEIVDKLLLINYLVLDLLIFLIKNLQLNPYVIVWYPPLAMSSMIIGGIRLGTLITVLSLLFLNFTIIDDLSVHSIFSLNLSTLGAAAFGAIIIEELQKYANENENLKNTLLHIAHHDFLTKLPNRQFFTQECSKMITLAHRKKEPLALLYLDLDHFKKINDTYGHQKGDEVLVHFANILRSHTRSYDLKGRFGGEEFVVCIYGEPLENVLHIADKIRIAFEKDSILPQKTTVSIGLYYASTPKSLQYLLQIADAALYEAKQKGRNNVVYKTN